MTSNHVIGRSSPPYRVLVPVRPSGSGLHRADRIPVETPAASARLVLSIGVFVAIPLLALNLRPAVTSVGAMLTEIRSGTGMSVVLASVVVAAPVWCFAIGGAVAWAMRTRLGTARTVSLALAALAATLAARVLAGPYLLLAGTVVACLAIAVLGTLLPVITHAAPARAWALLTGCYIAAMGGGSGIGALITPQVAQHSSWQLGVSGWALLAAAAWAAWRVASRRFTEPAVRESKPPGPSSLAPAGTAWSLTLHFGLTSGFTFSIMGWLPSILLDYSHVDPARVQWMFTVAMALGVPIALMVPKWARATAYQSGLAVALAAPSLVATVGLLMFPAWSPWLWSVGLGLGMPAVGLALAMISLRAAPDGDSAAALSSMVQGIGYAIAGATALFCGLLQSSTGSWDWPLLALLVVLCGQIVAGMHAGLPVTIHAGARPPNKLRIPAPRKPTPLPSAARKALPPSPAAIPAPLMHAPVLPPRPMHAPMLPMRPMHAPPPMHMRPPTRRPGDGTQIPLIGWDHRTGWPLPAPPPVRPPMRHPNGPWHGPAVPPLYGPTPRSRQTGPLPAIADNAKTGALIPNPRTPEPHPTDRSSTEVVVPKPRTERPHSALGESSATEKVVPKRSSGGRSLPEPHVSALEESSATEKVVPKRGSGGRSSHVSALDESSATEKVVPKPRVSALEESSATEKVVPKSPAGVLPLPAPHFPPPNMMESSATETVVPKRGAPSLPEPHFPALGESSPTEKVVPKPRSGGPSLPEPHVSALGESSVTEKVVPEPRAGEPSLPAPPGSDECPSEPQVSESDMAELDMAESDMVESDMVEVVIPEPRSGEPLAQAAVSDPGSGEPSAAGLVDPEPRAGEPHPPASDLAADVVVPEPRVGEPGSGAEMAREPTPEPRPAESVEVSAIYVAAADQPSRAEPLAGGSVVCDGEAAVEPGQGDVKQTEEPEQLELAFDPLALALNPEMYRDRTIHIPYPRQASS